MDKRLQLIQQIKEWNSNRLDLFEISLPNENLEFHGVLRFFFRGDDKKFQTKCLRVSSTATVGDLLPVLNEKFHPDMKMLSLDQHSLYEHHVNGERKLENHEKPLFIQLNWGKDDREGKFVLKNETRQTVEDSNNIAQQQQEQPFKRRWGSSKRKKKQKEIVAAQQSEKAARVPDSSFTRTISNPEEVMKRKRQQKLEQKLQQINKQDGTVETGGPLKIYGDTLNRDVPYKTLLLTVSDPAHSVVRETLEKYGMDNVNPADYCLVKIIVPPRGERGARVEQAEETVLSDHECPLAIMLHNPPARGSLMFQIRVRANAPQPPPGQAGPQANGVFRGPPQQPIASGAAQPPQAMSFLELPYLIELNPDGSDRRNGRLYRLPIHRSPSKELKLGSAMDPTLNPQNINIQHPDVRPLHCVVALQQGALTIRPGDWDVPLWVNNTMVTNTSLLQSGVIIKLSPNLLFRFIDPQAERKYMQNQQQRSSPQQMHPQQPQPPQPPPHAPYQQSGGAMMHQPRMQGQPPPPPPHQTSAPAPAPAPAPPQPSKPPLQPELLPLSLEYSPEVERRLVEQVVSYTPRVTDQYRFKLAPAYTLYLMLRTCHREIEASGERHTRLIQLANQMSGRIFQLVQNERDMMPALAFWMANASELLHFMKHDQELNSHTCDSQEILADAVQHAFNGLLIGFQDDVAAVRSAFISLSDEDAAEDHRNDDMPLMAPPSPHQAPTMRMVLQTMSTAMTLLRRCRVNAALTIQLFSQLFHFINAWIFNLLVKEPQRGMLTLIWGQRLGRRLSRVKAWAERQGLELAADCHLQRVSQACVLLATDKSDVENLYNVSMDLMRLNSIQLRALLESYVPGPTEPGIPQEWIDFVVAGAVQVADKVFEEESVPIRLEEEDDLDLPLLVPDDGYSCDLPVEGVPSGLPDYMDPLIRQGLISRVVQNSKGSGLWTVYMYPYENTQAGFMQEPELVPSQAPAREEAPPPQNAAPSKPPAAAPPSGGIEERVYRIQKVNNSLGLSIVAAKGEYQEKYGIYVKAVVPGGGAAQEGSLEPGDQLLEVEGMSLVGLVQEEAAKVMQKTGQVVTLRVAKRAAQYHNIINLITQPSPVLAARQQHGVAQQPPQHVQQQMARQRQEQMEKDRQQQIERQRQEQLERERQQQLERQRQEQLERERQEQLERERQQQLERQRQEQLERQRQEQLERQRQEQLERERQQQLERQRQEQLERERQQQLERQRQEQLERERQQQLERQRQEQLERERQQQLERQRQEQLERERQQQLERQRQEQLERERQQQLEKQRQEQMERERQQQLERQRQEQLERERQQQLERQRQEQMERERQQQQLEQQRQEQMERERQQQLQKQQQLQQLQQLQQKQQQMRPGPQPQPQGYGGRPQQQALHVRPESSLSQSTIPRGQPYPAMPGSGPSVQFRAAKGSTSVGAGAGIGTAAAAQPAVRVLNRHGPAGARPPSAAQDSFQVRTLPASHRASAIATGGSPRSQSPATAAAARAGPEVRRGSAEAANNRVSAVPGFGEGARSIPDIHRMNSPRQQQQPPAPPPLLSAKSQPELRPRVRSPQGGREEHGAPTHREPFWSETDLDSGGVIRHERVMNKARGQAAQQQTSPAGVSHAVSQPQLAGRRTYMETDVDHPPPPPTGISGSASQPDIHISGRSSEVRVMPPREAGDLPAAVIDHRPNQQHFYERTGPLAEPYLPPFSRMDTSYPGSSASAPAQAHGPPLASLQRGAQDSLLRVEANPAADRFQARPAQAQAMPRARSDYELATSYRPGPEQRSPSPQHLPPPPPEMLGSPGGEELPPPPANDAVVSSSSSSGNYQQLCHATSRPGAGIGPGGLPPPVDDSQATTASSLASYGRPEPPLYENARPGEWGYHSQPAQQKPHLAQPPVPVGKPSEMYATLASTVTASVPKPNASERTAWLNSRIRELEAKEPHLTVDQRNDLESLRVQLAFDNCANDRRRTNSGSSSGGDTDSGDMVPSESRARIAQIQMMRQELESRHRQRMAKDEQEQKEREQREKESQLNYQQRLQDFERERERERAKQQERTEQRAREQEEWLRKQQALREQQRLDEMEREADMKRHEQQFSQDRSPRAGNSVHSMYSRQNVNYQSSIDLPTSATTPNFGSSTLTQSKKTVSFSTDNLETVYRRSVSGEDPVSGTEDSLNSPVQQRPGGHFGVGYMAARTGPPPPPPKPRPAAAVAARPKSMGPLESTRGQTEEEEYQMPPNAGSYFASSSGPRGYITDSPTSPSRVIGAQEVYRDHYKARSDARNLESATSKRQLETKVETMSFSEKMRMFAARSGDANPPPTDKIKASSAQRLLEQR